MGYERVCNADFLFESEQRSPLLAGCYFSPVHQGVDGCGSKTGRGISFYIYLYISIGQADIALMVVFSCQVDDLREYVRSAV